MALSRGSQQGLLGEAAAPPLWAWGGWAEAGPEVPPPGAVGIQGKAGEVSASGDPAQPSPLCSSADGTKHNQPHCAEEETEAQRSKGPNVTQQECQVSTLTAVAGAQSYFLLLLKKLLELFFPGLESCPFLQWRLLRAED